MADLRSASGDLTFTARWEAGAPHARGTRAWLPIRSKLIHCRWSGESTWIPFGETRPDVGFENHTLIRHRGRSSSTSASISECEILFPYGACSFSSKVGQLAGNHFATLTGHEQLREIGRRVLWEGAQEIEISRAP